MRFERYHDKSPGLKIKRPKVQALTAGAEFLAGRYGERLSWRENLRILFP